ncbi:MAG: HD domain-containing protein [Anaerolineales bacterium]|nr:HD domain-containing protein [Anaerolineales bacterium]
MNVQQRVRQFFHALAAPLVPTDFILIEQVLKPELRELFLRMAPAERNHSIQVYQTLTEQGHRDKDLLAAALLHDVGKIQFPVRLYERVLIVLLTPLMRKLDKKPVKDRQSRLMNLMRAAAEHPQWGADLVQQAGGSEELAWLVRLHHDKLQHPPQNEKEQQLLALQAADRKN